MQASYLTLHMCILFVGGGYSELLLYCSKSIHFDGIHHTKLRLWSWIIVQSILSAIQLLSCEGRSRLQLKKAQIINKTSLVPNEKWWRLLGDSNFIIIICALVLVALLLLLLLLLMLLQPGLHFNSLEQLLIYAIYTRQIENKFTSDRGDSVDDGRDGMMVVIACLIPQMHRWPTYNGGRAKPGSVSVAWKRVCKVSGNKLLRGNWIDEKQQSVGYTYPQS